MKKETKFLIILTVFLSVLSIINLVSVKLVQLGPLVFPFGAYLYALTFPCTDVVSEIWGKERAKKMVYLGILATVLAAIITALAVSHPPAQFWDGMNEPFSRIFGLVPRLLLASLIAYFFGQIHDIWAFHFWKAMTGPRFLWLRNNLSTMVSQFLDTTLFNLIAFLGEVPDADLPKLILGAYFLKVMIAVLDTPVVYLLVRWVRG
ncbi:MAG: hypothetical protein DF168_00777 [Candidatus Moanabacter tarae]|uniref:Probable queuosine precursor transporter n=1 Tax=Candidatus Moanibacter tarae TaxID=2200854 RepID=A0A2Z4ADV0_9BACT|nr:MAG: hypothetical protein DF168_00777 [Candidatus Moanabacter tarae]